MVIYEVATISGFFLIEVRFRESFVSEMVVVSKLEYEAETRGIKVLHSKIDKVFESFLITISDEPSQRWRILQCREPELRDALNR